MTRISYEEAVKRIASERRESEEAPESGLEDMLDKLSSVDGGFENDRALAELIVSETEEIGGEVGGRPIEEAPDEPERELALVDLRDERLRKGVNFAPRIKTQLDRDVGFPIDAEGQIKNLVVVAPSDDFKIYVTVDDNDVVEDSFSTLEIFSNELESVSAYTTGAGERVVTVTDYVFNEYVNFEVRPLVEMTFDIIRAEVIIGRE